ncbi:MAG: hypothetical protein R2762_26345 [Bryobacteraceae bacterium]
MLRKNGKLEALRRRVVVASVGPVMSAALEAHGIRPGIVPIQPKMGALVKAAADGAQQLVAVRSQAGRRQSDV